MVDYDLDWQKMLPTLVGEAPSMPEGGVSGAASGGEQTPWYKNMLTPAAQGGGLEKLAIAMDLFGQGMGGKGFGATQMAQSSLANLAKEKQNEKQEQWREDLYKLISGMTPGKENVGGNDIKISSGPSGEKIVSHNFTAEGPGEKKEEGFTSSPFF